MLGNDPSRRGHVDATPAAGADELASALAAAAGDIAAQQRLVSALAPLAGMLRQRNARSARRLTSHEIEDAVQATLLSLWKKLASFDGRVPLIRWAFGFGLVELRKALWRRRRELPRSGESGAGAVQAATPPGGELFDSLLASLPIAESAAVTLKIVEGLTFNEIACRLKVTVSTVKTCYYRGLRRLRESGRSTSG